MGRRGVGMSEEEGMIWRMSNAADSWDRLRREEQAFRLLLAQLRSEQESTAREDANKPIFVSPMVKGDVVSGFVVTLGVRDGGGWCVELPCIHNHILDVVVIERGGRRVVEGDLRRTAIVAAAGFLAMRGTETKVG